MATIGIGQTYEIVNYYGPGKYKTIFGPGHSPGMWRTISNCALDQSEESVDYHVQAGLWVLHQDQSIKHAWFSAKHESMSGSWALVSVSGHAVKITTISDNPKAPGYNWSDKVYVGEVYDYTHHDKINGTSPVNYKPHAVNYAAFNTAASAVWHGVGLASTGKTETWPTTKATPRALQIGDICPVCTKEWKQRELATSVYVGCWCT